MKKEVLVPIGIVIAIVAIIGFLSFAGLLTGLSFSLLGGVTPLSLGKVTTVTDGELGESWLVSVSTAPSSFTLVGEVSKEKIKTDTGTQALDDFEIKVGVDQGVWFPITDTGNILYDYQIQSENSRVCITKRSNADLQSLANSKGASFAYDLYYKPPFLITSSLACKTYYVYQTPKGKEGIVNAQASFPSTILIEVTGDGKKATTQIDNSKIGSSELKHNGKVLGRVDYAGDLVNAASVKPEIFQDYKPINKAGSWYFTRTKNWNAYQTTGNANLAQSKNLILNCFQTQENNNNYNLETCVEPFSKAYAELTKTNPPDLFATENEGTQIFAKFSSDQLYYFPQLSFLLDVEWVGLKKLVGQPKILDAKTSSCQSGNRGTVTTTIQNKGSGTGVFEISLTCDNFDVLTSFYSETFESGEKNTYQFDYDTNTATKVNDNCKITTKDKGSFQTDEEKIVVSCEPADLVTPPPEEEETTTTNNNTDNFAGGLAITLLLVLLGGIALIIGGISLYYKKKK